MEIKDFIDCKNDMIIPKESKMIANVIFSGSEYRIYNYKEITDIIYNHYNCYIRFNPYDRFAIEKNNLAENNLAYYLGELSTLCFDLKLPLLSVMIESKDSKMPQQGFFTLCDKLNFEIGKSKEERKRLLKNSIIDNFDEIRETLIKYLNGDITHEEVAPIIKPKIVKQEISKITKEINENNNPQKYTIEFYEGNTKERTILQKERNQEVVKQVKERDNYTCNACGFFYDRKIVEVHHLIPISETEIEKTVTGNELITLCSNCHSLAHLLLNNDKKYENKNILLDKLKEINNYYLIGK